MNGLLQHCYHEYVAKSGMTSCAASDVVAAGVEISFRNDLEPDSVGDQGSTCWVPSRRELGPGERRTCQVQVPAAQRMTGNNHCAIWYQRSHWLLAVLVSNNILL